MNKLILIALLIFMSSFVRHKEIIVLPNGQKVTARQYKRMQYRNSHRHHRFAKRQHPKKIIVVR